MFQDNHINLASFPQEKLRWKAYQKAYSRFQSDPSPQNRILAQIAAQRWKEAFKQEEIGQ